MIVATGMHRFDTSLVTYVILQTGVGFGDSAHFCLTDWWNPKGYFEQRDVIGLHGPLIC